MNYSKTLAPEVEELVSCFECNSVKGDCVIGDCKGRWCKTSVSEDVAAGNLNYLLSVNQCTECLKEFYFCCFHSRNESSQ